ncbi:MAG: hypothetical protein K1000chlam2_00034 [Chlamydiae bacterium]|nr:hypothetical protein [Chlamydiota bacterium]
MIKDEERCDQYMAKKVSDWTDEKPDMDFASSQIEWEYSDKWRLIRRLADACLIYSDECIRNGEDDEALLEINEAYTEATRAIMKSSFTTYWKDKDMIKEMGKSLNEKLESGKKRREKN